MQFVLLWLTKCFLEVKKICQSAIRPHDTIFKIYNNYADHHSFIYKNHCNNDNFNGKAKRNNYAKDASMHYFIFHTKFDFHASQCNYTRPQ